MRLIMQKVEKEELQRVADRMGEQVKRPVLE
jgi:hypothetical protein